jgi:hypothetical protein
MVSIFSSDIKRAKISLTVPEELRTLSGCARARGIIHLPGQELDDGGFSMYQNFFEHRRQNI